MFTAGFQDFGPGGNPSWRISTFRPRKCFLVLDLLVVADFVLYSIGSSLRARRAASQNLQVYVLADKTVPDWKAGFSMAATQSAADTLRISPSGASLFWTWSFIAVGAALIPV